MNVTIRDLITAGVKTAVQVGVAAAAAALASRGIVIDAMAVEAAVFAIVTGLVAMGLNALGARFPIVNKIVSLGLSNGSAHYTGV